MTQSNSKVLKNKGGVLKTKVQAVTKLMRMDKVHEALPNANPNWKQQQNGNKKTIFFSKNMDTEEQDKEEAPKQTKRRKMTITKEDAPPTYKPLYGSKKQ